MNSQPDKTNYTTKGQREILESVGLSHVKGRTLEEADRLIQEQIDLGNLPPDIQTRPTEKQIEFLKLHQIEISEGLTKDQATELISAEIERIQRRERMTEKQAKMILDLKGKPINGMSKWDAKQFIEFLLDAETNRKLLDQCEITEVAGIFCPKCGAKKQGNESKCLNCKGFLAKSVSPQTIRTIHPPPHIYTPVAPRPRRIPKKSLLHRIILFLTGHR